MATIGRSVARLSASCHGPYDCIDWPACLHLPAVCAPFLPIIVLVSGSNGQRESLTEIEGVSISCSFSLQEFSFTRMFIVIMIVCIFVELNNNDMKSFSASQVKFGQLEPCLLARVRTCRSLAGSPTARMRTGPRQSIHQAFRSTEMSAGS